MSAPVGSGDPWEVQARFGSCGILVSCVETTFGFRKTRPAAGPVVIRGTRWAGTDRTANRAVSTIVKGVIG